MASAQLVERCSELDAEIKARQQRFGVELYNLLEEQDMGNDDSISPSSSLYQIKEHWVQVNEEIVRYHRKLPDKNKRRRRLRVGSINSAMTGQFQLQRKQKFGVQCFDIVFDMLGTQGRGSLSLLSKNEKKVHALIQKAVKDVLVLERSKEEMVDEDETPVETNDNILCGALVCCF